jgi:hypothetical protein
MLSMAAALLTIVASPALAQYPPLPDDGVVVSDTTVVPGQVVTVAGSGWEPGTVVTLTLFSDPVVLGTAEVDADTSFSTEVKIPETVEPGTHTLQVSGTGDDGEPRVVELTLEVLAAAGVDDVTTTADAAGLAFTGSNGRLGLGLAAALLVSGGVALWMARRRRNRLVINE